jgi:hypothetical protein
MGPYESREKWDRSRILTPCVRFPWREGFYPLHQVQTGHPASYPIGSRDKGVGGYSSYLHLVPRHRMSGDMRQPPIHLCDEVLGKSGNLVSRKYFVLERPSVPWHSHKSDGFFKRWEGRRHTDIMHHHMKLFFALTEGESLSIYIHMSNVLYRVGDSKIARAWH